MYSVIRYGETILNFCTVFCSKSSKYLYIGSHSQLHIFLQIFEYGFFPDKDLEAAESSFKLEVVNEQPAEGEVDKEHF